jgi:hypothetical protein
MKKRWRVLPDFPNYAVSDHGRIKRIARGCGTWIGRILKPSKRGAKANYLSVDLFDEGKYQPCQVHRLVAEAFVKDFHPALEVNHKDADTFNNHWRNLESVTYQRNTQHALEHGLLNWPHRNARHVYRHYGGWRVIIQGVSRGTFRFKHQALAKRREIMEATWQAKLQS